MFTVGPTDSLLTFNGLDLMAVDESGLFAIQALGSDAGMSFGTTEAVVSMMQSFLQDGSLATLQRHQNRTLTMVVRVTAADAVGLAAGAAALDEACIATWGDDGQIVPLTWLPPAGLTPTCVWDVVIADVEPADWADFDELIPERHGALFRLTLTCLPFVKASQAITTVLPAPLATDPVTPTTTSVDACDAVTNWAGTSTTGAVTGPVALTSTERGTYVQATAKRKIVRGEERLGEVSFTRTFPAPINMSTTPYLAVTCGATWVVGGLFASKIKHRGPMSAGGFVFRLNGSTTATPIVGQVGNTYYLKFTGTLSSLTVRAVGDVYDRSGNVDGIRVWVSDISRKDMLTAGTVTQKQISQQLDIQGSVRCPASVALQGVDVASQNPAALGSVIVHTSRVAATPVAVMQYCTGAPSGDTTAYSSKAITLGSTVTFDAPYAAFAPGGYLALARMKAAATGTYTGTLTTQTIGVGGAVVGSVASYPFTVTISAANTWQIVTLAVLPIPVRAYESADGALIRVTLTAASLTLDDAWLCDQTHGQTTVVDCGANTNLWIDSADGQGRPAIMLGTVQDRSQGVFQAAGEIQAWGDHEFWPDGFNVFTASQNPAQISLTYTPRAINRAPSVTP